MSVNGEAAYDSNSGESNMESNGEIDEMSIRPRQMHKRMSV